MINEVNPILVGLVVGIPSFLLGYLGYRRTNKADKATAQNTAVEQIIDGLNALVDNLQGDNKVLRDSVKELKSNLVTVMDERDKLKKQVNYLQNKYNPNYTQGSS